MLDNQTILDKHSVADYALIYPGDNAPSPRARDGIRYCLETEKADLYADRKGNILVFVTEADAFAFRDLAGTHAPVLAFHDHPMPDFEDDPEGLDEDEYLDIPDIEAPLDMIA